MRVLTTEEAATRVGVQPTTVRDWVARGHLRPVRAGAKPLRFREDDVIGCAADRMPRTRRHALDALAARFLQVDEGSCDDGSRTGMSN